MMFDSEGGSQAYLIFQPVDRYFKKVTNTNYFIMEIQRIICRKY